MTAENAEKNGGRSACVRRLPPGSALHVSLRVFPSPGRLRTLCVSAVNPSPLRPCRLPAAPLSYLSLGVKPKETAWDCSKARRD